MDRRGFLSLVGLGIAASAMLPVTAHAVVAPPVAAEALAPADAVEMVKWKGGGWGRGRGRGWGGPPPWSRGRHRGWYRGRRRGRRRRGYYF